MVGYLVFDAVSGNDAATLIEKRGADGLPIDLIVTDIEMPDGTGLELVGWVRQQEELVIPYLFVSGDEGPTKSAGSIDLRHYLLRKPFRPAQLLDRVSRRLREKVAFFLDRGLFGNLRPLLEPYGYKVRWNHDRSRIEGMLRRYYDPDDAIILFWDEDGDRGRIRREVVSALGEAFPSLRTIKLVDRAEFAANELYIDPSAEALIDKIEEG